MEPKTNVSLDSTSFLYLTPTKSFSMSPTRHAARAHPHLPPRPAHFLKVSPRVLPRAVIHPAPALRSLLIGAPLSHSNFMTGSARMPQKYDHFHDKTFIYNFIPSFKATKFAYRHFELPPEEGKVEEIAPITVKTRKLRKMSKKSTSRNLTSRKRRISPIISSSPVPKKPEMPKSRPILCVLDGQNLSSSSFSPYYIDLQVVLDRFIGPVTPQSRREVFNKDTVSLKSQAYFSLLERVTAALKPKKPFVKVFYVDGREVSDLAMVDDDCQVLLFSTTGVFEGLYGV